MREQAGLLASGTWQGWKEWILKQDLCEMVVHSGEGFQGLLGCCLLPYPNHFCISQSLTRFQVIWCISPFDVLIFLYRALLWSIHFLWEILSQTSSELSKPSWAELVLALLLDVAVPHRMMPIVDSHHLSHSNGDSTGWNPSRDKKVHEGLWKTSFTLSWSFKKNILLLQWQDTPEIWTGEFSLSKGLSPFWPDLPTNQDQSVD